MSARRPPASLFPGRLLTVLGGAWLALALVAGGCLNPSPDELPQADNHRTPTFATPAGVPAAGSVMATAPASQSPAAPNPELAPAPMPPTAQAAPFDAAAEPSDAGTDADPPDAE